MSREIKFKIYYKGKFNGYEKLTYNKNEIYWEWASTDINRANNIGEIIGNVCENPELLKH